ncbi:MAG: branched-chain amino acid transaminase [Chloroflexi bacterium]|nr:branched-chain amino acid transaminase [Chloroflexota bacterium]
MEQTVFFEGAFVPASQAKVSIMTHALHYGTACFEGIRGYWNAQEEQIYIFRMAEHYERLHRSANILMMKLPYTVDELCDLTVELVRRNANRQDVYIRPIVYKSSAIVGVRLHGIDDGFALYTTFMGKYIPAEGGARCGVSSWRRVNDNAIPARGKITGSYVNSALAKSEAVANGFDEAIVLTEEGHVSEGSGENVFLVSNGHLITPAPSENILVGITRDTIIRIARDELGIPTIERQVDRTELYTCDECFLCGTGAEITPVVEIDRRVVGDGKTGRVTHALEEQFYPIVRGENPKYRHWCTPALVQAKATAASQ